MYECVCLRIYDVCMCVYVCVFEASKLSFHKHGVVFYKKNLQSFSPTSKHQQIISLGRQPYTLLGGAQAFGVDFPPSISDQAITMQAPTTLQFTLPKGVTRFAADAVINWTQHDPPRARKWTDFTLYLRVDDKPIAELSFNAKGNGSMVSGKHRSYF